MGLKRTELVLQRGRHPPGEFAPGEAVHGAVVLNVEGSKSHRLRSVAVKVRGKAATDWKTGSGDNETHHWETQWLLRLDLPLTGGGGWSPGRHQLPFTFSLPAPLAYSQKHSSGKVVYECKVRAVSDSFWSCDGRAKTPFTILPHRDLTWEPALARPLSVQRQGRTALFSRDPGPFQVHLSRQGFVAGEVIELWLDGPDQAFEVLAAADSKVQLKTRIVFRAGKSTTQTKRVPAEVRPGRSAAAWRRVRLTVPAGEVSMDDASGCRIISVSHYVKVRDVHVPVVLGTVPLPPS